MPALQRLGFVLAGLVVLGDGRGYFGNIVKDTLGEGDGHPTGGVVGHPSGKPDAELCQRLGAVFGVLGGAVADPLGGDRGGFVVGAA